jgi:hypothetical protein
VVPIADQYNFQFIRTDETIDITLTPPVPSVPTILSVQSSIMFGDDLVIKWEKSTPEQPVNITVSGAVINDTNKYNVSDTGEGIMFLDYKFDITPNTYPLTVTLYRERKYDIPHPFELLNASIRAEDSKNVNCVVPEK